MKSIRYDLNLIATHFLYRSRFIVGAFGECSAACGNGTRIRAVTCAVEMVDGSFRELANDECKNITNKPDPIVESCQAEQKCPYWLAKPWEKVSLNKLLRIPIASPIQLFWELYFQQTHKCHS